MHSLGASNTPSATGIGISFVSCNHIWSPFEIGTTRIQTDISSKKQFKVEAEKTKIVAKFLGFTVARTLYLLFKTKQKFVFFLFNPQK